MACVLCTRFEEMGQPLRYSEWATPCSDSRRDEAALGLVSRTSCELHCVLHHAA